MPVDYNVRDAMLERYQIHTPKLTNSAKLKDCLLMIWNDLPQEFIDIKALVSFHYRVRSCVAAAGDILNTPLIDWMSYRKLPQIRSTILALYKFVS